MTTRKFSATDLPHPRYSLEIARFNIRSKEQRQHKQVEEDDSSDNNTSTSTSNSNSRSGRINNNAVSVNDGGDVNLPATCLPRFSQLAQVIEVKRPGFTLPGRVSSNIEDFLGSYCVIENARPELFIRRDFISKFVDKGTIQISQLSDHHSTIRTSYKIAIAKGGVLTITMNSKQYHRFGLIAKKVISSTGRKKSKSKRSIVNGGYDDIYRVEIDLRDGRIKSNNHYQDNLMRNLKRLNPINKIYFRFIPDKSKLDLSIAAANELSLEYFNYVIDEYALDGCKPVPLTNCCIVKQRVERNWVNYGQLHPPLNLSKMIAKLGPMLNGCQKFGQNDRGDNYNSNDNNICAVGPGANNGSADNDGSSALADTIEIVDWLGYQLLRLDCDILAEINCWENSSDQRFDVSCTQIIGNIDFKQVQDNLPILFDTSDLRHNQTGVVMRALILYDGRHNDTMELSVYNGLDETIDKDRQQLDDNLKQHYSQAIGATGNNNSGVVYLQDCSNGLKAAKEVTVIGMSNLVN